MNEYLAVCNDSKHPAFRKVIKAKRKSDFDRYVYYPFTNVWMGYVKIYSLSDYDGNVFYIGCTSSSLKTRLSNHLSISGPSVLSNIPKANKIAGDAYTS